MDDIIELMPTDNFRIQTLIKNNRGMHLIHVAAAEGREMDLTYLLENGGNVHTVDKIGNTALHYCGHKEIANVLLQWGADPLSRNQRGDTPLDLMKRRGVEPDVLTILSEAIKDIEQITSENVTDPLIPKVKNSLPKASVKYVKSVCAEFFSELGILRLLLVLFIVFVVSLYFAFVITGYTKDHQQRIPVINDPRNEL